MARPAVSGVLVVQHFHHCGAHDLPRQPELVLEPATLHFLAARGERGPEEVVDLLLAVAVHHERNRLGELEDRSAVQRRERLSAQLEPAVLPVPGRGIMGPGASGSLVDLCFRELSMTPARNRHGTQAFTEEYRVRRFDLALPRTVNDCLKILATRDGDTKLVAGGTDLLPQLKNGLLKP